MPAERRGAISFGSSYNPATVSNNTMAAPAPTGGFSFGGASTQTQAPAPAPTGGFSFGGAPTPTQAPAFGSTAAFGTTQPTTPAPAVFGSTTAAPTTGLFGNQQSSTTTAPAFGNFGSTTPTAPSAFGSAAPAPTTGLFGAAAPTPALSAFGSAAPAPTTGLFGAVAPTPAQSAFGSTAPALTTGLFGAAAPTPAPSAFGATGSFGAFGATQTPQPSVLPTANLAGFMSYSSLPSDQKNSIDAVYQAIMNHKRIILAVSTMAPKLLDTSTQQADAAAGQQEAVGLLVTVERLTGNVHQLEQQLKSLYDSMMHTRRNFETTTTQAICNAKWPTEFVAQRVGINLMNNEGKYHTTIGSAPSSKQHKQKTEEFNRQLKALLDSEMNHTDQVSRMPSPYLWTTLEEMDERFRLLKRKLDYLKTCLEISKEVSTEEFDIVAVVQLQEQTIWKVAADLTNVHTKINQLRQLYNLHERGTNVLEIARQEEVKHKHQFDQQLRSMMVKSLPATLPTSAAQRGIAAPAPTTTCFGTQPSTTTPAPAFGAPSATPAPVFGSTVAPALTSNIFGTQPSTTSLASAFGAPPPTTGLFGTQSSTTTPAPVFNATAATPGTGLFAPTSTVAATPKSKSRRNNTRRR